MGNFTGVPKQGLLRFSLVKYKSLWRFLVVGSVNTGVDFLLFLFLMRVAGVNYLIAQMVSYCFGVVNSFIMNRIWTFNQAGQGMNIPTQFVQFVSLNIIALSFSLAGLKIFNGYLGLNIYLAKIMVTGITWSVRYLGYKYWVFGSKRGVKGCENL